MSGWQRGRLHPAICYLGRRFQERFIVKPRFSHIALIGALVAAFALSGCGRKGPLDPPPGAAGAPPAQVTASPNVFSPVPERQQAASQEGSFDAQGRPIGIGSGPKRRLPIDWLLD
jgi:predicted small lipoprotein YifL